MAILDRNACHDPAAQENNRENFLRFVDERGWLCPDDGRESRYFYAYKPIGEMEFLSWDNFFSHMANATKDCHGLPSYPHMQDATGRNLKGWQCDPAVFPSIVRAETWFRNLQLVSGAEENTIIELGLSSNWWRHHMTTPTAFWVDVARARILHLLKYSLENPLSGLPTDPVEIIKQVTSKELTAEVAWRDIHEIPEDWSLAVRDAQNGYVGKHTSAMTVGGQPIALENLILQLYQDCLKLKPKLADDPVMMILKDTLRIKV